MIRMRYLDTVTIQDSTVNGYGDRVVKSESTIAANFFQHTGQSKIASIDTINSDAHVYLDPENEFIKSKGYRIEGMYIKANPFGSDDNQSWYKISIVRIGQDKLLENKVDNVHVYLDKTAV